MSRWINHILNESRFAIRSLSRRPAFTAIAALTLAIGIGANTSIFSVVHGVLLQALPYARPDRLVMVNVAPNQTGNRPGNMSYPEIADILNQLSGQITEEEMSQLNYQVDEEGREPEEAARPFLDDQIHHFRILTPAPLPATVPLADSRPLR